MMMARAVRWRLLAPLCLSLGACGTAPPVEVSTLARPGARTAPVATEDPAVADLRLSVEKLSAQLADAHRRYNILHEEYRRCDVALRDSQKKLDELQQKLDALRAIDRAARRQKGR
jgi:hypothetical protein